MFDICKAAEQKYNAGDRSWTETDQETYDYFLEVLPPIYVPGAFAPSEPWKDDPTGQPLFLFFRNKNGRREARYASVKDMKTPPSDSQKAMIKEIGKAWTEAVKAVEWMKDPSE